MVDIEPVVELPQPVALSDIKNDPSFEGMPLIQRGQRLSIQTVNEHHFRRILELGGLDADVLLGEDA